MSDESHRSTETESTVDGTTDSGWNPSGVLSRLEGPHTIGESRRFWFGTTVVLSLLFLYPFLTNTYRVIVTTGYLLWVVLALSLTLVWGYTGIFSFGQTAFFGLGGYVFGVVGLNLIGTTGATNVALLVAIVLPAALAGFLGYFIFYGRISGVYVGIVTFSVALILGLLFMRTSGVEIGTASLGGLTGMNDVPDMVLGWGPASVALTNLTMYYLALVVLVGTYFGLRYLLNSDFGYVMVAVREDEERTEMFGYDTRFVQLLVFVAGAGLAGLAGAIYASATNYIGPSIMSLTAAALPVIWVTVGGRRTLLGSIVGAFGLQYLDEQISLAGSQFSLIALATIVIAAIIFFPEGIVPNVMHRLGRRGQTVTSSSVVTDRSNGNNEYE